MFFHRCSVVVAPAEGNASGRTIVESSCGGMSVETCLQKKQNKTGSLVVDRTRRSLGVQPELVPMISISTV
jgi:hypothetical protein